MSIKNIFEKKLRQIKPTITTRVLLGSLSTAFFLFVIVILSITYTRNLQNITNRILSENVSSLKAAEELDLILLDQKGSTSNFLLTGDSRHLDEFNQKIEEFNFWLINAQESSKTNEEKELISQIRLQYIKYLETQRNVVRFYRRGEIDKAHIILLNDMQVLFRQLTQKCRELLETNEQLIFKSQERIETNNFVGNIMMISLALIGIISGLVLGIIVAKSLTKPIYELVLNIKDATGTIYHKGLELKDETEFDKLDREVRDLIQKLKRTNEELAKSEKRLLQSEKLASLGKISAGVAHEIRNPLTAIKMLVFSLGKETNQENRRKKDFELIVNEIDRIDKFISNFLNFARPTEPARTSFDIHQLIDEVLDLIKHNFENKYKVHKNYNATSTIISADRNQIFQVIINLVLNSIEAMSDGGSLNLFTSNESISQNGINQSIVKIDFVDDGKGIPDEIANSIFDPFVTTKEHGTGLGLSIIYEIMEKHGGWIEAKNNPSKGATFTIYFPQ